MRILILLLTLSLGTIILSGCQKERTEATAAEKAELQQRQEMINKTMQNRPNTFSKPGGG
ncbi:hypothetical protein [Armatimonas sp.]|uniref:hypothetical protein n=1 Tax=Armatimonas sp. TaxID=1872638 RepID=UPI00286C1DD9|nr:hypothetical protein [Armatimonas sp.]